MFVNEIKSITAGSDKDFDEEKAKEAALAIIADEIGATVVDGKLVSSISLKNTRFNLMQPINCSVIFA